MSQNNHVHPLSIIDNTIPNACMAVSGCENEYSHRSLLIRLRTSLLVLSELIISLKA
jgi:hypothetical protein